MKKKQASSNEEQLRKIGQDLIITDNNMTGVYFQSILLGFFFLIGIIGLVFTNIFMMGLSIGGLVAVDSIIFYPMIKQTVKGGVTKLKEKCQYNFLRARRTNQNLSQMYNK